MQIADDLNINITIAQCDKSSFADSKKSILLSKRKFSGVVAKVGFFTFQVINCLCKKLL